MKTDAPYSRKDIVEEFMPESLPKPDRLMSLLSDIHDNEHDMGILASWTKYFRGKRIPFVVLRIGGTFRLYKERRI